MKQLKVDDLEIHPFNAEIYGPHDAGLAENIDKFGLQTPIKVDPQGRILSGGRRWTSIRKLGWEEIPAEVPDVDFEDERAVQLYVLIANAYRQQKTSYQQKREADAYARLYDEGALSKDDLRERAEEREGGNDVRNPHTDEQYDKRGALAARAAGLSPTTYSAYRYFDGRGDREIERAVEGGQVSKADADDLRGELGAAKEKVAADQQNPEVARRQFKDKIREAKKEHTLSPDEKAKREAEEAVDAARKKGRAYIAALERLFMDHRDALDGEMALVLTSTFREHRGLLQEQLPGGFLTDGSQEVEGEPEAIEVGHEVVG